MHSGLVSCHCKQGSVWPALLPALACAWNIIHQDIRLYSLKPLWVTCLAWESHQHTWHWHAQPASSSQFLTTTGTAHLNEVGPECFFVFLSFQWKHIIYCFSGTSKLWREPECPCPCSLVQTHSIALGRGWAFTEHFYGLWGLGWGWVLT